MSDFFDDITQPPTRRDAVREPTTSEGGGSGPGPGGSPGTKGGGSSGSNGPGPGGEDNVIDRAAIRQRLREQQGDAPQAMEVVNEDEGDEPPAPEPAPAPEPPPTDYGPEEVPNEADDPDFVGPLPTDNTHVIGPGDPEYGGPPGPVWEGPELDGMFNPNPDEVMAPTDGDGIPIEPDDDFGFGGIH